MAELRSGIKNDRRKMMDDNGSGQSHPITQFVFIWNGRRAPVSEKAHWVGTRGYRGYGGPGGVRESRAGGCHLFGGGTNHCL